MAIVVLNWNGKDDTLECLESLGRLTHERVRIVVVDNGSTDGSVDAIRARHPEATILCTGRNLGYAAGNNVGLRATLEAADVDYVLVLNNDTVVDPSLLDRLLAAAREAPGLVAFGPRIYFLDRPDHVWFAGAYWQRDRLKFDHVHYGEPVDDVRPAAYPTDYITGCALFVSSETLRRVGFLDERFFLIYEEVDWCYRLRRLGGECRVVPDAHVWHKVSSSFGGEGSAMSNYFTARNELLWAERHLDLAQRLRLRAAALAAIAFPELGTKYFAPIPLAKRIYWSVMSRSGRDRRLYRDRLYRARRAGVVDYLRRRFGDCPAWVRPRT